MFSAAWCVVGLGVLFPGALPPGKARASGLFRFVGGRCHVPCFSPLAKTALGFATPGSFCAPMVKVEEWMDIKQLFRLNLATYQVRG